MPKGSGLAAHVAGDLDALLGLLDLDADLLVADVLDQDLAHVLDGNFVPSLSPTSAAAWLHSNSVLFDPEFRVAPLDDGDPFPLAPVLIAHRKAGTPRSFDAAFPTAGQMLALTPAFDRPGVETADVTLSALFLPTAEEDLAARLANVARHAALDEVSTLLEDAEALSVEPLISVLVSLVGPEAVDHHRIALHTAEDKEGAMLDLWIRAVS